MNAAHVPVVLRDGPAVVAYALVQGTRDRLCWWMVLMPARQYGLLHWHERDRIAGLVQDDFRVRRAAWCDRKVARLIKRANAA